MNVVYTKETDRDLDEVGKRLEQAVRQRNFSVLDVVDIKENLNSRGIAFIPGCRIYEVCNPRMVKKVLENNMAISTALPCRISIYEEDGITKVSTILPAVLLNIFHATTLWTVANQVEIDIKTIIDDVTSVGGLDR